MPRGMWIWCLPVVLLLFAVPARADFVISIGSPTIPQGGTGTLDVLLTSTAGSLSPDLLNNYAFTLQITGPNELMFSTSQSFAYLTNSQYVFFGDSIDQMNTGSGGTVSTSLTGYANDTFVGNDSTASGNPVSLTSANTATPVLLAALTLDATITSPGDSYSISLGPSSGDGSMNTSSKTVFDVVDFANTGLETSSVPFTSTSGTVMIGPASVPEPASLVSGLIGMITLAGFCGVRRLHRIKQRST
ncbi:MAG: hypothetical protein ACHRXM_00610 [Isosphaerales bacterium]